MSTLLAWAKWRASAKSLIFMQEQADGMGHLAGPEKDVQLAKKLLAIPFTRFNITKFTVAQFAAAGFSVEVRDV